MKRLPRWSHYVAADPDDRWSRLALAENFVRMGRFDQAESALAPLAADDSAAIALRFRSPSTPSNWIGPSSSSPRPGTTILPWPGSGAGWPSSATTRRPCVTSGSHSHPIPRIVRRCSGSFAPRASGQTEAAEPFRETARKLERLNTLIHRAAARESRDDPALLRDFGAACTALHRDAEARAWYELAITHDPLDAVAQRAL